MIKKMYALLTLAVIGSVLFSGCYWKRSCKTETCEQAQTSESKKAAFVPANKHGVVRRQSGPMPHDAGINWDETDKQ